MKNFRRRLVTAAAVLPLVGAGLVATAGPAAAVPNLCTIAAANIQYQPRPGSSWTRCTAGSGWFRVRISCKDQPNSSFTHFFWGDWVSVQRGQAGATSSRQCEPEYLYIVGAVTEVS